jgi:hypothetical protein
MDAEINNVVYMELYSGPKMAHDKYRKTNIAGSIDPRFHCISPCCLYVHYLPTSGPGSSVGITTDYGLDGLWIEFW